MLCGSMPRPAQAHKANWEPASHTKPYPYPHKARPTKTTQANNASQLAKRTKQLEKGSPSQPSQSRPNIQHSTNPDKPSNSFQDSPPQPKAGLAISTGPQAKPEQARPNNKPNKAKPTKYSQLKTTARTSPSQPQAKTVAANQPKPQQLWEGRPNCICQAHKCW